MATALAKGFVQAGLVSASKVIASIINEVRAMLSLKKLERVPHTSSNIEVLKGADVLFVAVKPDQVDLLLDQIRDSFSPKRHFADLHRGGNHHRSLIKGPSISGSRIVRVMPTRPH